jgi:hypothetical protein
LRFLPLWSANLRAELGGRPWLLHAIERLRTASWPLEIVICVPVLLLAPVVWWRISSQSHCSHLSCQHVRVSITLVGPGLVDQRTRLWWKVALLLHRLLLLRRRAILQTSSLCVGAARLLVASRAPGDRRMPPCGVVFPRRRTGIQRSLSLGVIHREVAYGCAAGVLDLVGCLCSRDLRWEGRQASMGVTTGRGAILEGAMS